MSAAMTGTREEIAALLAIVAEGRGADTVADILTTLLEMRYVQGKRDGVREFVSRVDASREVPS